MLKVHDLLFCGRDIACKHAATFAGAKLVDYTVLLTRTTCHLRGRDSRGGGAVGGCLQPPM